MNYRCAHRWAFPKWGGALIEQADDLATATAGTMMMRDGEDKPQALFGYTAYVADGANPSTRPLLTLTRPTSLTSRPRIRCSSGAISG